MGIETLIIFIAMILVAAVASGVLIKTSGLLQTRALAVGTETTERVVTGFEIVTISANANTSTNSFNEIETLVRLQAGSYDMSFLALAHTINTPDYSFQANLMHTKSLNYINNSITYIGNNSWVNIGNIDVDPDDIEDDHARLVWNISDNIDGIEINLSSGPSFIMSLGADIENGTLAINNVPVIPADSNRYNVSYGFFTYTGNASPDGAINTTGSGGYAAFHNAPNDNECTFENLIPNHKYCIVTKIGDGDWILETGELMAIRYKLSSEYSIGGDENFDLRFIPKRGTIIDVSIYVPEVLQRKIITLWP